MNSRQLEKYRATLEGLLREVLLSSQNGKRRQGASGFIFLQRSQVGFGGCDLFFCFAPENLKLPSAASSRTPPRLRGEPNHRFGVGTGRGRGGGPRMAAVGWGGPIPQPGASSGPASRAQTPFPNAFLAEDHK